MLIELTIDLWINVIHVLNGSAKRQQVNWNVIDVTDEYIFFFQQKSHANVLI